MARLFGAVTALVLLAGLTGCGWERNNDPKAATTNPNPKLQPATRSAPDAQAPQQGQPQDALNAR